MPDKSHAGNAKARASQAVNAGRMSKSTEAKIDAKANRVLGKSDGAPRGTVRSRSKQPDHIQMAMQHDGVADAHRQAASMHREEAAKALMAAGPSASVATGMNIPSVRRGFSGTR